ncbi:methyltransferase, partial [bacterium]|nr:methyltransferase [bacterium]
MILSPSGLITAPWKVYILFAAVRLNVFTIIGEREVTAPEIANECGAVPKLLEHLLNACVGMDLIKLNGGKYTNTHFSQIYLIEGTPRYLGDFINILYGESLEWLNLAKTIKGDEIQNGSSPLAELDAQTFTRGMDNLGAQGEAEAMRNAVDLLGCREMVDVGGGSGLYSRVLCQKYPGLTATILDRKPALEIAQELNSSFDIRDRIRYKEADITQDSFGENVDVVLISDVIYDKINVDKVLKNAFACLKPNGKIIIRGYYSDPDGANPLFGALFVLNMITSDPSREIVTITSLQDHLRTSGFTGVKAIPLTE